MEHGAAAKAGVQVGHRGRLTASGQQDVADTQTALAAAAPTRQAASSHSQARQEQMGGSGRAVAAASLFRAPPSASTVRSVPGGSLTRDRVLSLALIAPSIIAVGVFVYGFIGWTGFVSLTQWNTCSPDYTFVGLHNYVRLLRQRALPDRPAQHLVFTLFFVVGVAGDRPAAGDPARSPDQGRGLLPQPLPVPAGDQLHRHRASSGAGCSRRAAGYNLLLGLDPTQNKWFTDPIVIPGGPNGRPGTILNDIGLGFLASTQWGIPVALLSLVIAAVWQMSGYVMALYLAGLRGIPESCARRPGSTAPTSGSSSARSSCRCSTRSR